MDQRQAADRKVAIDVIDHIGVAIEKGGEATGTDNGRRARHIRFNASHQSFNEPDIAKEDAGLHRRDRSLRQRTAVRRRLDGDQLLAALTGLYLLATVRDCRDSLALNALFDQTWTQVGQALETHVQRNLELFRQNPADRVTGERRDAAIKLAELRFNSESADVLRRARDGAERRAGDVCGAVGAWGIYVGARGPRRGRPGADGGYPPRALSGRGLWLARRNTDTMTIDSRSSGTTITVTARTTAPA